MKRTRGNSRWVMGCASGTVFPIFLQGVEEAEIPGQRDRQGERDRQGQWEPGPQDRRVNQERLEPQDRRELEPLAPLEPEALGPQVRPELEPLEPRELEPLEPLEPEARGQLVRRELELLEPLELEPLEPLEPEALETQARPVTLEQLVRLAVLGLDRLRGGPSETTRRPASLPIPNIRESVRSPTSIPSMHTVWIRHPSSTRSRGW